MNVAQLLTELITACNALRQVAGLILSKLATVAQENVPFHITTQVDIIEAIVTDSTFGNQAIRTALDAYYSALAATTDATQTAVNDLAAGIAAGTTVTVIADGSVTQLVDAIWSAPLPTEGTVASTMLANAHYYALYRSNYKSPLQIDDSGNNYYQLTGNWNVPAQADPDGSGLQNIDFNDIIESDNTCYEFVTRAYPSASFVALGNGLPAIPDTGANTYWWVVNIPDDEFQILKRSVLAGTTMPTAPVWPGLAGATLGTPVALDLAVTVTGPMAGVIVELTGVPALKGQYDYDGLSQSLKIGALTFVSDNGDAEYVQALGFTNEVYVPKNMAIADSCKIRAVSGVTGTATPFTIP